MNIGLAIKSRPLVSIYGLTKVVLAGIFNRYYANVTENTLDFAKEWLKSCKYG